MAGPRKPKKAYKTPKVVELGTLAHMTRGLPGTGFDVIKETDLPIIPP